MTIVLDGLIVPTFILSIIYLLLTLYGCRRLLSLHKQNPRLNTRKVFVMSCLLSTFLRVLSFGTMSGLNYFDYKVTTKNTDSESSTQSFFDKASLVMFDLPDFCFVSAYILLLVVWCEAVLASRKHWIATSSYKQQSLLVYLVFNIVLYSMQVVLYMFMFVPSIDQKILVDLIYLTMGAINLGLPTIWICIYLYLSLVFSGFPYHSTSAYARMISLNRLGSFWTVTRLLWGVASLTTATKGWLQDGKYSSVESCTYLICIFTVCEIIPILVSYRSDSLRSLVDPSSAHAVNPVQIDDKNSSGHVDASIPFMSPDEKSTEGINRSLGDYFGASPLQRSHTWASDDGAVSFNRGSMGAASPMHGGERLSELSDRDLNNARPGTSPQNPQSGGSGNWNKLAGFFGY